MISSYDTFMNMSNLREVIMHKNVVNSLKRMGTGSIGRFQYCTNLKGHPMCGINVTDMGSAYQNCYNITGSPVCGPNVFHMNSAYMGCYNLTGSPVCSDNVRGFRMTYFDCFRLTGSPVCGPNVTDMDRTYSSCRNLTGSPVCGPNVTRMIMSYENCYNLTGSPVCGDKVNDMSGAYANCYNLTGSPVCGDKVTNMECAYRNCPNVLTYDFSNMKGLPTITKSSFDISKDGCKIIMPIEIYGTWDDKSDWKSYESKMVLPTTEISVIDTNLVDCELSNNTQKTLSFRIFNLNGVEPNVTIIPVKSTVCSISDINVTKKNSIMSTISFNINALDLVDNTAINISITANDFNYKKTFNASVTDKPQPQYTVETVAGAQYGFKLNEAGYYESQNKGVNGSYAICKINIINKAGKNVYLDCINYGEKEYDYGILSNINTTLDLSNAADTANVKQSFKSVSSSDIQTVEYGAVDGFIYVKYIKDISTNIFNDSLQFKVRFE